MSTPPPSSSQHAGFDSNFAESYPALDTQAAFLTSYVRAVATQAPDTTMAKAGSADGTTGATENSGGHSSATAPSSDEEAFVEALRTEVNRWTLPSHLWWSAWAVVQARYSPIDFDFVDYARLRLAGYRLHKEAFFGVEREKPPREAVFECLGQKPS